LTSLSLGGAHITDDAVDLLILSGMTARLRYLDLRGAHISDAGVLALAASERPRDAQVLVGGPHLSHVAASALDSSRDVQHELDEEMRSMRDMLSMAADPWWRP
jgi:hypothetical protein